MSMSISRGEIEASEARSRTSVEASVDYAEWCGENQRAWARDMVVSDVCVVCVAYGVCVMLRYMAYV